MVTICAISQRSSVSPMRSTMTVARARCRAGTMNNRPVSIDARLRCEGQSEKQHDKEISDRADRAEQEFQGLAYDRAAAGGDRAGAWKIMCRSARRCAGPTNPPSAAGIAEIEIAGVDPVLLKEGLDADQLRFDRIAQHGGLLRDGAAAEEDHARQQAGEHQTDDRQPQRMRQPDDATEQLGHGVERDTEQHSGKDQKQRRGEIPGEQQQRCEQRRCRCRRPISPKPDRCGLSDDRQSKVPR